MLDLALEHNFPLEDILLVTLARHPVSQLKSYLNWIFKQSVLAGAPRPLSTSILIKGNTITTDQVFSSITILREVCNIQTQYLIDLYIAPSLSFSGAKNFVERLDRISDFARVKVFDHNEVGSAFDCIKLFWHLRVIFYP